MALIFDSRIRAIDANGNPLVGATLTIYDAGTTTLSSVYRDADLTSAMTNPTSASQDVSDSGGWFPQIFAAESASFDITLKTAGAVVVKSWVSTPALGGSAGIIYRDYSNSRLRIAGSAGVVRFEGGHPIGNDLGGYVSVGGYSGSQADTVELDGAAVNVTGALTEGGKKMRGVVSDIASFSAVASVVIPLTNSPTGVRMWEIDIIDLTATGSGIGFTGVLSEDGGVTYVAAGYATAIWQASGAAVAISNSGSASAFVLPNLTSGTNYSMRLRVVPPSSVGMATIAGDLQSDAGATSGDFSLLNGRIVSISRPTHLKLIPASGTITGRYRVMPQRGFGE